MPAIIIQNLTLVIGDGNAVGEGNSTQLSAGLPVLAAAVHAFLKKANQDH